MKTCKHCGCNQDRNNYFRPYDGNVCAECRRAQIRRNRAERSSGRPAGRPRVAFSAAQPKPPKERAPRQYAPSKPAHPVLRTVQIVSEPRYLDPALEPLRKSRERHKHRMASVQAALERADREGMSLKHALMLEGVI